MSQSADGAFVAAWVWVSNEQAGVEEVEEEDTDEVCPHCGEKGVAYGAHCNMVDHEDTHISEGYCPEHGLVKTVDDAGIDKCPDCGRATSFDAEEAARFEHQDDEPESNCERGEEPISKEGYARDGNCGGVLCRTCSMKDDALPPDPEGQNDDRAKWAGVALDAFQSETGADDCDKLGDLLGDLMHWCDRNNQEFEWALDRAREYYRQETLSEPDDDPMDVASTVCPEAVRGSAAWEASGREPMSISPLEVLLLAEKAGVKR